jgi:peptide/nickel transport system substrate-binding protein
MRPIGQEERTVSLQTSTISRRQLLKGAATTAGLVAVTAGVAACGGGAVQAGAKDGVGSAKRGGTLRIGVTDGGTTDNIDAGMFVTNVDGLRLYQLYNSLYAFDKDAVPQLSLAEEVTPNKTATEWTVRLRKGVLFHNGKELAAEDVVYTYQRILDPKTPLLGANFIKTMDIANAKIIDRYTVSIPFHSPFGYFPACQATYFFFIVPVGYAPLGTINPKHPIGTGPFKFESFTPGVESSFTRNENYWQNGQPYVDRVVITDCADETSQLNGLASNSFDLVDALSGTSIPVVESAGGKVLVENGEAYGPFTMRTDKPPFNDVRVRQAMRLIVDRPQMLKLLFNGAGMIGNDLYCIFDSTYDHALPQRHADPAQARYLLKQAGYEDLSVTLVTADVGAGSVQAAQVFAQQALAAGVTVKLDQVTSQELYGPNYLQWTFAQDDWNYNPYVLNSQNACLPGGEFNECHVSYPRYTQLWQQLAATLDPNLQAEITHEMQTLEYEGLASGFIVPYFIPSIDGMRSNVSGLTPSKTGNPLGGFDLQNVWFA